MKELLMSPLMGYGLFVLCASVILLWVARQARIATEQAQQRIADLD